MLFAGIGDGGIPFEFTMSVMCCCALTPLWAVLLVSWLGWRIERRLRQDKAKINPS